MRRERADDENKSVTTVALCHSISCVLMSCYCLQVHDCALTTYAATQHKSRFYLSTSAINDLHHWCSAQGANASCRLTERNNTHLRPSTLDPFHLSRSADTSSARAKAPSIPTSHEQLSSPFIVISLASSLSLSLCVSAICLSLTLLAFC